MTRQDGSLGFINFKVNMAPQDDWSNSFWKLELVRLGLEHPSTLARQNKIGNVLHLQGKYEEAEVIHRETLDVKTRVLGPELPDTLTSMANLVSTYRNQGRWKEAEELDLDESVPAEHE